MSMDAGWSNISQTQQSQFLQATGLQQLPEPSKLSAAQFSALAGIVGTEKANTVAGGAPKCEGGSVSAPSMPAPKKTGDWSNVMMLVAQLQAELGEIQTKVSVEDIKNQQTSVEFANEERASQIQERLDKLDEQSQSSLAQKIFGWIGAIAGLLAAAAVCVMTGGAAAAIIGVVAAGLSVAMKAVEESGVMDNMSQGAKIALQAVMLAVTVVSCVVSIGGAGKAAGKIGMKVAEGVADKAGSFANTARKVAQSLTKHAAVSAGKAFDKAQKVGDLAKTGAMITSVAGGSLAAVGTVGEGVSTGVSAVIGNEAAKIQADMKDTEAWLAQLQSVIDEQMERLGEILQMMQEAMSGASDAIASISESHKEIYRNMGV